MAVSKLPYLRCVEVVGFLDSCPFRGQGPVGAEHWILEAVKGEISASGTSQKL